MFAQVPTSTQQSVTITSIRNGLECRFDTGYHQRLTGHISAEEFHTSIERINEAGRNSNGWIYNLIGAGMLLGGMLCIIITMVMMSRGGFSVGFPFPVIIGFVLFASGGIFLVFTRRALYKRITDRMFAAVSAENAVYATRGIAWRLHQTPSALIVSNRRGARLIYDYTIEIEFTGTSQVIVPVYAHQPVYAQQPENMNAPLLPPSYQHSSQPAHVPSQPYQVQYQAQQPIYQPPQPSQQQASYQSFATPQLALCQQCQNKLRVDEKFCSQCGTRVSAAV